MSYSDNPVRDADRHIAAQAAYGEALDAEAESLKFSLLAALTVGQMEGRAHFLPQPPKGSKPTIAKVWAEAFDCSLTDSRKVDLALLLRDVAMGKADAAVRAKAFLDDAAADYGRANAEVCL